MTKTKTRKTTQSHNREDKLYLVTHGELSPGYQVAQVAHAVAELAISQPERFTKWHTESQYIIALQTPTAHALNGLYSYALERGFTVQGFWEPDIGHALTAIAFVPHPETPEFLASLPLAGSSTGEIDKHSATIESDSTAAKEN